MASDVARDREKTKPRIIRSRGKDNARKFTLSNR